MKQILSLFLLLQILASSLLHQVLQVVGILFHTLEEVVHDVQGLSPGDK